MKGNSILLTKNGRGLKNFGRCRFGTFSNFLDPPLNQPCTDCHQIDICLWNARNLVNKLTPFQLCSPYPIHCITESWLNSSILDSEVVPSNYCIFRKDRPVGHGGGVALCIHNSITCKLLPSPPNTHELLFVEILTPHPIVLFLVYLPPGANNDSLTSLLNSISCVASASCKTIILGHFNFPDID